MGLLAEILRGKDFPLLPDGEEKGKLVAELKQLVGGIPYPNSFCARTAP